MPVMLVALAWGVVTGATSTWWLRRHDYRLAHEVDLPQRRHWWVAALMPLLMLVPAVGLGSGWPWWVVAGPLGFIAAWMATAGIDADIGRLPNALTLPLALASVGWSVGLAWAVGEPGRGLTAILGGLALAGAYLAILLVSRVLPPHQEAIGLGDVKLALSLGAVTGWFGWPVWTAGLVGTFTVGAIWAVSLLAAKRVKSRDSFSFGPAMVIGTAIALILG